jgi:hypothetical protein
LPDVYIQKRAPVDRGGNNYRIYLPAKEARDAASLGKYLPLIKKAG